MKRNFFGFLLLTTVVFQSVGFAQAPANVGAATAAAAAKAPPAIKISPLERKFAEGVTAEQLKQYLYFVASDEMEGRDTPSRGLDTTAKFIAFNLTKWGFKPAGDDGTFFQKIALHRDAIDPTASFGEIGGQRFAYGDDVVRAAGANAGTISGQIVYAGDGWMIKSKNLNPYAGLDVKGKIIAVYSDAAPAAGGGFQRTLVPMPAGVTQADLPQAGRGTDWADVTTYATANGAAGVIVLPTRSATWPQPVRAALPGRFSVDKFAPPPSVPVVNVSPKLAAAIFAGESANPLAGTAAPFSLSSGKTFSFTTATKSEHTTTQNVVALWEGSDPVLKNEMVAIGAHYDHIGLVTTPNAPDKVNNGADDDGSGTVSVLSIAEALAHNPQRPKRSVLFVWHCGEEKGLWGSQYFNAYPTVNIKNVIAQLNIDMIGRSKKPGYMAPCDTNPAPGRKPCNETLTGENDIYVIGKDMMASVLGDTVSGVNSGYLNLNYDTRYDDPKDPNRFFYRSDHFNYAKNGIPIAFWFDGEHEDYHRPGDEPQKIDYVKMEKVARTIAITLWELTNLKDRPKIDKELPAQLAQPRN
ncbi:MAG TPA: M28 family peptidase [Pyrinomonadaceae bacterium]|nr:M28 family peptidase [Pyrinomonadaceae bacterium]